MGTKPQGSQPGCEENSFVAGTKVLIADGSTKPIEQVQSDSQLEGLTAAMIGWAVDEFSLTPRDIEVSFDRGRNGYSFAWSKEDRPSAG